MKATAIVLGALIALSGCDDMRTQAKQGAYRSAAVGPGPVPVDRAGFGERPTAPPLLTRALIVRGQDRFRAFCTPCHGELGDGNGMVAQRGFPPPPSYHVARLREVPTQHLYDVITHGYGVMYSFAQRVPPDDRWAIAAYIRALQRSTDARSEELTLAEREALR